MNAFVTLTLLAVAASACEPAPPMKCGPEEMMCPGGMDSEGCALPDICSPMKSNILDLLSFLSII